MHTFQKGEVFSFQIFNPQWQQEPKAKKTSDVLHQIESGQLLRWFKG